MLSILFKRSLVLSSSHLRFELGTPRSNKIHITSSKMSNQTGIQKVDFSSLSTKNMGDISTQTATLEQLTAVRVIINPGGSWSKDLKALQGTDSCQKAHVGYMLSGRLAVRMDDGQEEHSGENTVFVVRPGHDAWCVGDEPCVFVEFSCGSEAFLK